MAKTKKILKEDSPLSLFSLAKLAALSKVDYYRIYHVVTGNRKEPFNDEEKERLSKAIVKHVNLALEQIGTSKRVTTVD